MQPTDRLCHPGCRAPRAPEAPAAEARDVRRQSPKEEGSLTRADRKKELYKLAVARSDVTEALRLTEFLIAQVRELSDPIYLPLYHAVVAAYARPFKRSQPLGKLGDNWAAFGNPRNQATHDRLITLRDKVIAHSDAALRPAEIYPPGSRVPIDGTLVTEASVCLTRPLLDLDQFPAIRTTCLDLGNRLEKAVNDALADLYDGRVLPVEAFPLKFDEEL